VSGRLDLEDGLQRALPRGAARAVSAGEKAGLQLRELPPGRAQLFHPFRGFRRDELEAEGARMLFLRLHVTARGRDWERASARSARVPAPLAVRALPPGPRS